MDENFQEDCPAISSTKDSCNEHKGHPGKHQTPYMTPKRRVIWMYWTDSDPFPKPEEM